MDKGHGSRGWMLYFWLCEGAFALIGGANEMWVYWAFTPPSQFSWPEAFLRAFITQFAIVGFGAAGVKSYQLAGGGWRGILAAMPANLVALFFAFVTFWLMRISAVAFRNDAAIGSADNLGLWLPQIGTVDGRTVTLTIIAGVPFFQWALSVFGPVIVAEKRQLSAEEILKKGEADLAQARVNEQLAQFGGRKLGAMIGGVFAGAKGEALEAKTPQLRLLKPGDIVEGSAQASSSAPPVKGPWNKDAIRAWLRSEYPSVKIAQPALIRAMKVDMGAFKQGTQLVADPRSVRPWARRIYGRPLSEAGHPEGEAVG